MALQKLTIFLAGIVSTTAADTACVLCHVKAQTLFRPVEELEKETDIK